MKRLFTEIAAVYDRMNHVLSVGRDRAWRRRAAACLAESPAQILDLASGTGDFAFALKARFPSATILGVDVTPAMLAIARAKNVSPDVSFVTGDVQDLSALCTTGVVVPGAYALVSCAFGFRNFPDKAAALAEAYRMLAPGGRLVVLEFFRPTQALLGAATTAWLRVMTALFARRRAAAYAYLRASMAATVTEGQFVALAARAGFRLEQRHFFWPCCTCLVLARPAAPR